MEILKIASTENMLVDIVGWEHILTNLVYLYFFISYSNYLSSHRLVSKNYQAQSLKTMSLRFYPFLFGWRSFNKLVDQRGENDHIDKGYHQAEKHPDTHSLPEIKHIVQLLHQHAQLVPHIVIIIPHTVLLL